jgi:hypothetical protein
MDSIFLQSDGVSTIPRAVHSRRALWTKYAFICAQASLTAATPCPIGVVRDTPPTWRLFREVLEEAVTLGRAEGVLLPDDLVDRQLALASGLAPTLSSSLYDDLVAGRRIELEPSSVSWFATPSVPACRRGRAPRSTPCALTPFTGVGIHRGRGRGRRVFVHPSIEHSPAGFTMSPKISTHPRGGSAPRPDGLEPERAIPQHGEPVCSVGDLCAELRPVRATDLDQVLRRARARPAVEGDGRLRAIRQLAHLPDVATLLEPTDTQALRHPRSVPPGVGECQRRPPSCCWPRGGPLSAGTRR